MDRFLSRALPAGGRYIGGSDAGGRDGGPRGGSRLRGSLARGSSDDRLAISAPAADDSDRDRTWPPADGPEGADGSRPAGPPVSAPPRAHSSRLRMPSSRRDPDTDEEA